MLVVGPRTSELPLPTSAERAARKFDTTGVSKRPKIEELEPAESVSLDQGRGAAGFDAGGRLQLSIDAVIVLNRALQQTFGREFPEDAGDGRSGARSLVPAGESGGIDFRRADRAAFIESVNAVQRTVTNVVFTVPVFDLEI